MNKFDSISVVIPCYCCSATIERAVESILNQQLTPSEVILVDDCSPDDTLETLHNLASTYPAIIKVISCENNGGPGRARNLGWDHAKGQYIAFLDSDDSWHPSKLKLQLEAMKKNPEVMLSGHRCGEEYDINTHDLGQEVFVNISLEQLLFKNYFSTQTVMVKNISNVRFKDDMKYSEDYKFACDIAAEGHKCIFSKMALTKLYKASYGESGLSANISKMALGELYTFNELRKRKKIGIVSYLIAFSFLGLRVTRRYFKFFLRSKFT